MPTANPPAVSESVPEFPKPAPCSMHYCDLYGNWVLHTDYTEIYKLAFRLRRQLTTLRQALDAKTLECEWLREASQLANKLNALQHDPYFHGFTCGNQSSHRPLIATLYGWKCADCDYTQEYRDLERFMTTDTQELTHDD